MLRKKEHIGGGGTLGSEAIGGDIKVLFMQNNEIWSELICFLVKTNHHEPSKDTNVFEIFFIENLLVRHLCE